MIFNGDKNDECGGAKSERKDQASISKIREIDE